MSLILALSVFISYDYGDTFLDKTEKFQLNKNNTIINSTVDLFVTHPKFNTVSEFEVEMLDVLSFLSLFRASTDRFH